MNDIPDKLRALLHAGTARPSATVLETEIRSQGAPNFKTEGNANLRAEIPTQAAWEWTYGVPATDVAAFIDFLQQNEAPMIADMRRITQTTQQQENRLIFYRGTFVSATSENGWYECRTVWAYSGDDPIAQWVALLADAAFRGRFVGLRRRWTNDPGARERLVSLLQLYTFPDDFLDPDNEAAYTALLEATLEAGQP